MVCGWLCLVVGVVAWRASGCEAGHAKSVLEFRPPFLELAGEIVAIASASPQDLSKVEEVQSEFRNLLVLSFFVPPQFSVVQTWELPPSLGNSTNLAVVFLQTVVSGTVPTQFGLATSLKSFALATNEHLEGTLPSQLALLTNLEQLRMFSNPRLTGAIPTQLGLLANLDTLILAGSNITGPLPSQIAQLTKLHTLDLNNLPLTGTLPTQLVLLTALRDLRLERLERMHGTVPGALLSLPLLQFAGISFSGFVLRAQPDGPIAPFATDFAAYYVLLDIPFPEVGSPDTLLVLALGETGMTDLIPSEIGLYSNLQRLILPGNHIFGAIPSQLAQLTALTTVHVHHNQLDSLPSEIELITSLETFVLSANRFSGPVPTLLGALTKLSGLYLDKNAFSGSIPPELGQLTQLTALSLSYNRLSGVLPSQLGLLSRLVNLFVEHNALSGTISPALFSLSSLESAVVEHNNFQGTVPPTTSSAWVESCDESGLDNHACAYACGACARLELQLRGCDWRGRGQWCAHFAWLVAALFMVVGALAALQCRLCGNKSPKVATRTVRGAYCTVELFLDFLFTASSSGGVFCATVVVLVGVAVGRLALVLAVVRRLKHDYPVGVLGAVVAASTIDVSVASDSMLALGQHIPLRFTLAVIALGLVESCVEGALQLLTIQRSGGSLVTVMAFVFSTASLCALVVVALVLSMSHFHSRARARPGGKPDDDEARAVSPRPPDAAVPEQGAPTSVGALEVDEGGEAKGERKGARIARWKLVCCLCCVVAASLSLPNGQVAQSKPVIVSRPGIDERTAVSIALPLRDTRVTIRKQTGGAASVCDSSGSYAFVPPFVCILGSVVAMVDSLGETDLPLEEVLQHIPTALFVVLSEGGSEIPTTIGELSGALVLALSHFESPLPSQIGRLSDLVFFDYDWQSVLASLPSQIGLMTSLSTLRVRKAFLPAMPSEIGLLTNVEILEFETVTLRGTNTIPTEYGLLRNLQWLQMTETIKSTVPSQFGRLGNLTVLWSPGTSLAGELPTQLGLLGLLTSVRLQGNRLWGVATPALLDLPLLREINLSHNKLSGQAFSGNWRPHAELGSLNISSNSLVGTMPTELGLATQLSLLGLASLSGLSGTIPSQLGLLHNLTELALSGNALSGELPSQLALLTNLQDVSVAGNDLRGRVPPTFSDAQRDLWLEDCDYSGLDEPECARACPRCAFNELRASGCDDRGYRQVCLPFFVVLLAVAVVGFGMQRVVRRLVSTRVSLRELALASAVSAVGAVHTLLDVMFANAAHGWISWTAVSVLVVAVFLRVGVVLNEFVRLHVSRGVHIGDHAKMFAVALLFCVVDPSTVSSIVADLGANDNDKKRKKKKRRSNLMLAIAVVHLVQDIPMLAIQAVAVSGGLLDVAPQALLFTAVSVLVASRLWVPWVVSVVASAGQQQATGKAEGQRGWARFNLL